MMRTTPHTSLVLLLLLSLLSSLTACHFDLHSELDEHDANTIISVLARHQITASKSRADRAWTIAVSEDQHHRALSILDAYDLPRKQRALSKDRFDALLPTPLEIAHARRLKTARSLEDNLASHPDIFDARVLFSSGIPNARHNPDLKAAARLRLHPNSNVDAINHQEIALLVASSLPDLIPERVHVSSYVISLPETSQTHVVSIGPLRVHPDSRNTLLAILAFFTVTIVTQTSFIIFLVLRDRDTHPPLIDTAPS